MFVDKITNSHSHVRTNPKKLIDSAQNTKTYSNDQIKCIYKIKA